MTSEWLYYQIGAVELLSELRRWPPPRVQLTSADDRKDLSGLHDAMLQRVQRSLRTRDAFFRAYNLPQNLDAIRTMLVELDALLVLLMGAADASARFIHEVSRGVHGGSAKYPVQMPPVRDTLQLVLACVFEHQP